MGENIIMLFLREYHFRAFQYKKPQNGIPSHKTILTDLREPLVLALYRSFALRAPHRINANTPRGGNFPLREKGG